MNKKELIEKIKAIKTEADLEIMSIPDPFQSLQDSENYNYYSGVFDATEKILKIIGE